jgi:hypothetical protein
VAGKGKGWGRGGSGGGTGGSSDTTTAPVDTVTIIVEPAPAPITSINVTPASDTVYRGRTEQFLVSATRSDGSTASPAVTWRATGGSVDAGGYYTAPSTDGQYLVIATTDQSLADTSRVTVVVPPNNEPAGYTRITENTFLGIPLQNGALAGQWSNPTTTNYSAAAVSTPSGDGKALRILWPAGLASGKDPGRFSTWDATSITSAKRFREVYVSFNARIERSDFENQAVGTKLFYFSYGNTNQVNDAFLMLRNGTGGQAIQQEMELTMYVSPTDDREGGSYPYRQNVNSTLKFRAGDWQFVEVQVKLGTPNQSDGQVRVWINGTLITDHRGVKFLDTDYDFTQGVFGLQWSPVWGGVGGTRTRDDSMVVDNLYASGILQ